MSTDIFIPEFLSGFLLVQRANLDASERANVLAAIRGEFSPQTVATALREQWSDTDLARRDKMKASSALVAMEDQDDELAALMAEDDEMDPSQMNSEDCEAYMLAQTEVEDAMEAVKAAKNTLKEARWKQKQARLGRGFYPAKPFPKRDARPGGGGARPRGGAGCFKCGGPHFADQCPLKGKVAGDAKMAEEAAEIAFYQTSQEQALGVSNLRGTETGKTMEQVVDQCLGIIDSGATASLGSLEAMQKVMEANIQECGESKMKIDLDKKPVFRFGNGAKKACVSTVSMGVEAGAKAGKMEIHIHDAPGQPILVSRKALKALGAVIDFGTGEVVYRKVDERMVVPLAEAANGHLLMPMTGNLLEGGTRRTTAFEGLRGE